MESFNTRVGVRSWHGLFMPSREENGTPQLARPRDKGFLSSSEMKSTTVIFADAQMVTWRSTILRLRNGVRPEF